MQGEEVAGARRSLVRRLSGAVTSVPRDVLALPRDLKLLYASNVIFAFGIGLYGNGWAVYLHADSPRGLGAGAIVVGDLLSLGPFVAGVLFPVGGLLADRWDRKRVVILGTILQVLAPVDYYFAQAWWQVIPGIVCFYGGILAAPAFIAYLSERIPREGDAEGFGLFYTSLPLGMVFSPLLGAYLVTRLDFRDLFPLVFVLFLVSLILVLPVAGNRPRPRERRRAGGDRIQWGRVALLALFPTPFLLATPYFPLLLNFYGYSDSLILALGSITALGMVGLSWGLGRMTRRMPRWVPMAISTLVFLPLSLVAFSPLLVVLVPGAFLMGAPNASRALADPTVSRMTEEGKGWILSLYLTLENLGAGLFTVVGGVAFSIDEHLPFLMAIPLLVLTAAIFAVYPRLAEAPGLPRPGSLAVPATLATGGDPPNAR